jgi:rsbT co-antagonist protein RsbR
MTGSPPQTTNGAAMPAPLAAFRAFLEAERPALATALLRDLTEHAPHYRTMSDEQRAQRVNDNIDVFLAGLDDPDQLASLSEEQLSPLLAQGLDLDAALRLTSIYRQRLLSVALRALEMGVEGAAPGLQSLMELVDLRARALSRSYQERLRLFETLVDNSPDGIGVSGLDGKQIHPNPAFRAMLGYGDELIGLHFSEYVADEDPAVMQQLMEQGFWQGMNTYRRKDGSTFRGHSTIFLIPGPDGQPVALGGVIRDISEQLRAQEELKRQADELSVFFALAENSPDGVLVTSHEGLVSYANQALRALLGYQETMTGVQFMQHLATTDEQVAEIGQQIMTHGAWRGMISYRRRDGGTIPCHASSFLIRGSDDDPGVIASVVRDLTGEQRAEQERLALQEQVIAAQQAALRELSTPLIPIADGVVAMPLIGSIDSGRAQMVVEELLRGVAGNRATTAIVDITGVPVVDTQVAGALVRAAQAVELLGARVLLTGIRPEVAQTLVGIGVSLGSIITRSTLQDGITFALGQRDR